MTKLIVPDWPLPKGVAACSSTRIGGGRTLSFLNLKPAAGGLG